MHPIVYGALRSWQNQCEQLEKEGLGDRKLDVAPDTTLKAREQESSDWSSWWDVGGMVSSAVSYWYSTDTNQAEPRKVQKLNPLYQKMNQMARASEGLGKQLQIDKRFVEHIDELDLENITVKELKAEIHSMLDTAPAQLVKVHEGMNRVLDVIKQGVPANSKAEIDGVQNFLGGGFKTFGMLSDIDNLAEQFDLFSESLNFWLESTEAELDAEGLLEGQVAADFEILKGKCQEYLHALAAATEAVVPEEVVEPEPEPEKAIPTTEALLKETRSMVADLQEKQNHGPELTRRMTDIAEAFGSLTEGGKSKDAPGLVQEMHGLYLQMLGNAWDNGFGESLSDTLKPLDLKLSELDKALRGAGPAPVALEEDEDNEAPVSLQSLTHMSMKQTLDSLESKPKVEREEYQLLPIPGEKGFYIPVTNNKLDYFQLTHEPRFAQKDFEYLRVGDFRVSTRSSAGPAFQHERSMSAQPSKWKVHLSLNRDDMDRAFPIIRNWIMNPENRMFCARVISQQNRESEDMMGKEFTFYLFDEAEFQNKDPAHWQAKLSELENILTRAGVRPGPRPEPQGHKFDARIKGSRFCHYRNDSVRVEKDEGFNFKEYRMRVEKKTGRVYYQSIWDKTDYVVLASTFNQIPPNQRHNLLASLNSDFLAEVDMTEHLDRPHKLPPPVKPRPKRRQQESVATPPVVSELPEKKTVRKKSSPPVASESSDKKTGRMHVPPPVGPKRKSKNKATTTPPVELPVEELKPVSTSVVPEPAVAKAEATATDVVFQPVKGQIFPENKRQYVRELKEKVKERGGFDLSEERLMTMLQNPATGEYMDLGRYWLPTEGLIKYLRLQQIRPDSFPDFMFSRAYYDQAVGLHRWGEDSEEINDIWLNSAAGIVEKDLWCLGVMQRNDDLIESLMPGGNNFEQQMQKMAPEVNVPDGIPMELRVEFRKHVCEEFEMFIKAFGEPITRETVEGILHDCCYRLLEHVLPDFKAQHDKSDIYMGQQFEWMDKDKHTYKFLEPYGFISYCDRQARSDFVPYAHGGSSKEVANKFRISVHPHQYEEAWNTIAEVLHRKDCPFPTWKSTYPWCPKVGKEHERLKMGGQFTLYSLDHNEGNKKARFQPAHIAETLQEIENALRAKGIRPGQLPPSDIYFGQEHPYISYRFDMDKERRYYESAARVLPERREEYYNEQRYRDVKRCLA